MKNTYIVILVLLLVLGIGFFVWKSNKLEAPTYVGQVDNTNSGSNYAPESVGTTTVVTTTTTQTPTPPVKEFTVTAKNFSFTPSTITVNKGDRVKITFNNTEGFHDFVIDEFGVATKQGGAPATEVLEFTATKTGSFEYYCSVGSHRSMGMFGTLKVQ